MPEDITTELYEALKLTLEKIRGAFGNSAYFQHSEYMATHNKTPNWFFKAKKAIKKFENNSQ